MNKKTTGLPRVLLVLGWVLTALGGAGLGQLLFVQHGGDTLAAVSTVVLCIGVALMVASNSIYRSRRGLSRF